MAESKSINEEKTAAASYILNFYSNVAALTHNFALYTNLITELKEKYKNPTIDFEKLDEAEKQIFKETVNNLRYFTVQTYTQYKCIILGIKKLEDKEIESNYLLIKDSYYIGAAIAEKYTIALNSFLVKDIIKSLLESSQQIATNIYKT